MKKKKQPDLSVSDLMDKSFQEPLTQKEVDFLVDRIKKSTPEKDSDLFHAIKGLRFAGLWTPSVRCHRKLLERFLHYPSNTLIASAALRALCHWGYEEAYLPDILKFIAGVDWDDEQEMRRVAIRMLGGYLFKFPRIDYIQMLVDILDDPIEEEWTRQTAFEALADFLGKSSEEIEAADSTSILGEVRQRLKELNRKKR